MPKREMLINFVPGEECRIAIAEAGRLEEFYQERASAESHVGNIYKGRVSNVEPAIQAAFVDFGLERNGFLHISDLHPMYFPGDHKEETELVGQKTPRRERPPIQRCLRRGQEILVQVLKEGIGTKGPTLTSYLSVPGRYLVMMPYMERLGVSRKIEDDEARRESRKILEELKPPEGFGFIIRTAGIGRAKTDLKRDLAYLVRLWKTIERRMKSDEPVGELYTESDLLIRTLRDVYSTDIERIIVDNPVAGRRARDFLAIASPRAGSSVLLYKDPVPLFHRFNIESQIENINARMVALPSGGSLVFDQAEALVAIDVNSGKFRDNRDAETTAYKTDMEACDEVCRQLRLRDLGGVVVIDMIDVHQSKHRREIEQRFRNNLKNDRARTQVLPMSRFGIIEMTRQRMRPSLTKSTYTPCAYCQGRGQVRNAETVVLDVMRRLALAMQKAEVTRIELMVSPDVAFQLLNKKRAMLVALEERYHKPVMVRVNAGGAVDFIELACFDHRNSAVPGEMVAGLGQPTLEPVETDGPEPELEDVAAAEEEETLAEEPEPAPPAQALTEPGPEDELLAAPQDLAEDENIELDRPTRPGAGPGHRPNQARGQGQQAPQQGQTGGKRRRRRRGRRGRGHGQGQPQQGMAPAATAPPPGDTSPGLFDAEQADARGTSQAPAPAEVPAPPEAPQQPAPPAPPRSAPTMPAASTGNTLPPRPQGQPQPPQGLGLHRRRRLSRHGHVALPGMAGRNPKVLPHRHSPHGGQTPGGSLPSGSAAGGKPPGSQAPSATSGSSPGKPSATGGASGSGGSGPSRGYRNTIVPND